jgi:hypothetical protein
MEQGLTTILTAKDMRQHVNLIQEVMKAVMKDGVHYGIIPGCQKPSLYKPGAEKIASTFRIAVTSDVEDLSNSDEKRYRVTCTAYGIDGNRLGSSVGECSSNEEKYRWRKPVCEQEFEEADIDRKREKWIKTKDGNGMKIKQLRTEPSDLANTILQMADKRAYVAIVRKVTAASDVFTQDIEDLPEEIRQDAADAAPMTGKPAVNMPKEKEAVAPYADIIALSQGKKGDVLNVQGYAISVEHKQFPDKVDKNKKHDVSFYTIADLPKDPTIMTAIKVFGIPINVGVGQIMKFNQVTIGEYKGKSDFMAKEVICG